MKKTIKFSAIILSLCLILSIFPLNAFAGDMSQFESVQIFDVVLDAGSGYFSDYTDYQTGEIKTYFRYSYLPNFQVTLKDGNVINGSMENNNYPETRFTDPQSFENQWLPGNTYTVNATVFGFSTSFNVTIKQSDVQSVQLDDINLYEGLDSQATIGFSHLTQSFVEYIQYSISYSKISGSVVFSDGNTNMLNGGVVNNNNKYYSVNINYPQNPDNTWEVGGTYPVVAVIDGFSTTLNVHICENPVESVVFDDVEIIESSTGYNYYPNATITFKDGTVRTQNSRSGVDFEKVYYYFSFIDNQNETPWEVGNTYTATGIIMGVFAQFNVSIVPTPVTSIKINDIELYENFNGFTDYRWIDDPDNPGNMKLDVYYRYTYYPSGTVTFSDGKTENFSVGFDYKGQYYTMNVIDNQPNEHWEAGHTYTATATVMGVSTQFNVTIKEIPFVSFTADDVLLSTSELNRDYFYLPTKYHFIRKDGSEYTVNSNQAVILDDGKLYSVTLSNYPNMPWVAGEYVITATFGNLQTTFTVTASETKAENGYSYLESKDGVIITEIDSNSSYISIPNTLAGKDVIGISGLGVAQESVKNLVIPDGVKFISSNIFTSYVDLPLETLCLGKDINNFNGEMLINCTNLKNVYVSEDNQYYCDDDGVLYNKSKSKLVWYPLARSKKIELSSYIEDFSCLDLSCYSDFSISFIGEGGNYITVDGVTYNGDKTYIIFCDKEKSGNYEMPDTVLNIRSGAFLNCKNLTGVTVSNNVTEIMYATFAGCDSLKNINFPNNLKSLGDYAISDCPSIEAVILPQTLESIGERCFTNDIMLSSINFPEAISELGYEAFSNTGFVELNLPSDEHYVSGNSRLFADCKKLKTVAFAQGRRYIDTGMFENCALLENVTMPDTVEWIYEYAFQNCVSLKNIELSNNLTYMSYGAFAGSGLVSVVLPDSLSYLGEGAFSGCEDLINVRIGTGLDTIAAGAFAYTGITEITIPANVSCIGNGAFIGCSHLTDVTIENKDAEIYGRAFSGCPIKEIPISNNAVTIYQETYKGSAAKSVVIPNSVTDIMYGAFEDSADLLDITMPTHLDSLGRAAFDNTAWYNTKPNGYIIIDDYILYGYKGDYKENKIVNIDKNITVLAGGVFENGLHGDTSGIERIIIPDGVKRIPENAFTGCVNLKSVTIPASVQEIYYTYDDNLDIIKSAFNNCPSLTDIYYLGTKLQWTQIGPMAVHPSVKIHFVDELVPFEISIANLPDKNVYKTGESLDTTGMAIKVLYSNGSEEIITGGFDVLGFDSSEVGVNNLTVYYNGLSCTYTVTIEPKSIATSGKCGENAWWDLNLQTGVLNVCGVGDMYDFANTNTPWYESLSQITTIVFGKDISRVSEGAFESCSNLKTIIVNGANTVIEDSIDEFITVIAPYGSKAHRYAIKNGYEFTAFPEIIKVHSLPKQTVYAVGEPLHTEGLTILVFYPNGTMEYRYKGFEVKGYDNTKVGKQTLTIDYLGITTDLEIEVKEGVLISDPNASDLAKLRQMLLGTKDPYLSYDFNKDGIINILDLVSLKKILANYSK